MIRNKLSTIKMSISLSQTNSPKLTIVFLNYNRLKETIITVNHLRRICYNRKDIEIIGVDNGSTDGTALFLESHSDWLITLKLNSNCGIKGLNQGFEIAKGDYIFVLDDDSHPLNISTIDLIIESFGKYKHAGAVACKIVSNEQIPFHTWHIPHSSNTINNMHNTMSNPNPAATTAHTPDREEFIIESLAFVGCGFAVRRELFKQIGWFQEEYFLYQNEIAAAIKIRELGYKIYYDPRCTVVHRASPIGRAGWRQVFYPTRNTIWLLREYAPFPLSIYYIFSRLCFGLVRALQSGEYLWYLKAVKEGFQYKITKKYLKSPLQKELQILWNQNSIIHQIKSALIHKENRYGNGK